jgi:hypothetical protein
MRLNNTKAFALAALCGLSLSILSAQTPAERLKNGGSISFRVNDATYNVTGPFPTSGNFGEGDPIAFTFSEQGSGTGMDIKFRIRDLIGVIDSDYEAVYMAHIIDSETIEWSLDAHDIGCVAVNMGGGTVVNFRFDRIYGKLTARLVNVACQNDPLNVLNRSVSLSLRLIGGNAGNFITAEGYAFCFENPATASTAQIENVDLSSYGGGLSKAFGNVNGDCIVDDSDLLQVLFAFGSNDARSDTNSDGVVDDSDLLTVLFNFGLAG